MSLRNSYKSFYSEGVAAEHPDVAGQKEFANKADEILAKRKRNREQSGKNAKLDAIGRKLYNMNKIGEETELGEAKVDNSLSRGEKETARNKRAGITNNPYIGNERGQNRYRTDRHIDNWGEKKEKGKKENNWTKTKFIRDKSGKVTKYQDWHVSNQNDRRARIETEEFELGEKIDVGADVSKTISDFVHSKNKIFKGDSKKQRIKRALGAYYAAQREETENIYNYVIETLVAADYAENYETAENMFECMSDEFVAVILEDYIEEKARGTRKKTTVHAYDVDETLFGHGKKGKPNVQVHVNDASGKRVKSLSNQEFNTHKLDKDKGHSYDFSEFQSAKKFSQTASPNKKVIKDIKRKQARGQNVHLITARSKFDKPSEFQAHLEKHGVNVDKSKIHYTGGMKGGDIGKKKVDVANAVAKQSGANKIHMYDDAAKVHKAFEKEKKNKPTSAKIKTHMVAPDKKGESRVRSYQATKEEVSSYDYWKQFID
jgi:hypothetical protein